MENVINVSTNEKKDYPVDNENNAILNQSVEKIEKSPKSKKNIDNDIEKLTEKLKKADDNFVKAKNKRNAIAEVLAAKEKEKLDRSIVKLLDACKKAGISIDEVTELVKNMKGE